MKIGTIKIPIVNCAEGIYLRWYFNGYHYFLFRDGYQITMKTESMDTQVTRMFSVISKIERATRIKSEYAYQITLSGITAANIGGFTGLLLAEKVEQYEGGIWREVDITRGDHLIRDESAPGYILDFEITRKELPYTSSVYQKSQKLYIGDTLCDIDDDEVIPINKQVNDIAEMQDRQSDFTAQFKIRKTRAMRSLFELSGEVGATTNFPYQSNPSKLVQDGIEMFTAGKMILDKVDDQYYYVSVYSGNISFFKAIENLKITDLTLAGANHPWTAPVQAGSNVLDLDYVYPLCEPSDDGGITPLPPSTGDRVEVYGGFIWPFIRVKAIWDEIFSNASYVPSGAFQTDSVFLKTYLPISKKQLSNIDIKPWMYSIQCYNTLGDFSGGTTQLTMQFCSRRVLLGNALFYNTGQYLAPFTATYQFRVLIATRTGLTYYIPLHVYLYVNGVQQAEMSDDGFIKPPQAWVRRWTGSVTVLVNDLITVVITTASGVKAYTVEVTDITDIKIDYGDFVYAHLHLPEITQTDFVKMVCNLLGIIPEVDARKGTIFFWNLSLLYDNIPQARDWSKYLSERDDEVEFKFGEYAQLNYLKYKDSDDVKKDAGMGIMQVSDETLPASKDVVTAPVATCDEVIILNDVIVSRIAFNEYKPDDDTYTKRDTIDPRIVYVDYVSENLTSPVYQKTFGIRTQLVGGTSYDSVTPKKASSMDVSFTSLIGNYSSLSKMLDKTNLRRCKFNLPAYEVAGLKHYIPIYLSQYKAYFYVNKINNYVPGKLCQIDLIKL